MTTTRGDVALRPTSRLFIVPASTARRQATSPYSMSRSARLDLGGCARERRGTAHSLGSYDENDHKRLRVAAPRVRINAPSPFEWRCRRHTTAAASHGFKLQSGEKKVLR
ncbi:unnamed protein product [Lampetra planeri]